MAKGEGFDVAGRWNNFFNRLISGDPPKAKPQPTEMEMRMAQAYSPQSYYGGKGMAQYSQDRAAYEQAMKEAAAVAAARELIGGSTSGGATSGGYNIQAAINQINDSFARQQQALDQSRSVGQQGIQGAYNTFSGNIGRNYADYTGATQQAQAAMAQRVADQIAQSQARQAELQRSAQSMGQNYGALTQQQAGNVEAMRAAAGFQQDLGQRMAQVVANNQRALEGSGELVRQGAIGNLETNYQALLGALQAAREQQIMSAQAAGSGGGGGGGGKSRTAKDAYDEVKYTNDLISMLMGEDKSQGAFGGVSTDKLFDVWYNASTQKDDPVQQAIADTIAPYLANKAKK